MRRILTAILAIISIQAYSQVSVSDSLSTERFQVRNGAIRGTYPKASAYVDVNTSGLVAIRQLGSDRIIVNYQAANLYVINGANTAVLDSAVSWLGDVIGLEYCCGSSGGGSDTIILDGNAFIVQGENTALEIDGRIELDGDSVTFSGISSNDTSGNQIYLGIAEGVTPNSVAIAKILNSNGEAFIIGFTPLGIPVIGFNIIGGGADYSFVFTQDGIIGEGEFNENVLTLQDDVATGVLIYKNNGSLSHNGAYSNAAYIVDDTPGGFTIPDNKYLAVYDPAALQANATITFPANPYDGQIQAIAFGGAITSGTVVTTLSLATSGGQTINVGTAATTGTVEQPLTFQFLAPLNKWYLISK